MIRFCMAGSGLRSFLLLLGLFFCLSCAAVRAEASRADFEEVFGGFSQLVTQLRTDPEAGFLRLAQAALGKGAWQEARDYGRRVLSLNSQNLEAKAISGVAAAFSKDLNQARRLLQELQDSRIEQNYLALLEAVFLKNDGKPGRARKTLAKSLKKNPEQPLFHYFFGEMLLFSGDLAKAEGEFKWVLNREPDFGPALAGLGQISLARKEWRTAARFLRRALEHDPENLSYYQRLQGLYRQAGEREKANQMALQMNFYTSPMKEALLDKGRQWLRRGDFVQALTEMDRFFSFYRKAPEGWYIRAAALTNLKRHREARRDLGTFLVYSWGVPQAHQKAGICLLAMEDVDGAAGQFKEAVAKDPLTGDSLLFLLVLEQMRGNFKDALKGLRLARAAGYPPALVYYLEGQTYLALQERSYYGESLSQAADLIPGFAADAVFPLPQGELWRSVARDCSLMVLYYRNGWYGKALEAGERLIKPCPQDIFVRYFVACSQEMLNRPQKAKNSFLQLIQIHPGLAEGFLGLGRTASQTGALEAAEAALGKALRLDPDSAKAYVCRGDLQVRRGETQAATASYRRALSLDPLINAAYPRLSRLLAEKADTLLEAADLAQKARESMPSDPLALDAVGWITILEGKTEEGLAGIEAAHAGRPDDPIILYHMGSAQFLLGAFGKARHSLQQAFALSADFSGADRAREILDELSP